MKQFLDWLKPIWQPHAGQAEFLLSRAKTKILACGRRWGKTEACAVEVLKALSQTQPIRYLLVAPTLDQARILFDRVLGFLEKVLEFGMTVGDSVEQSVRRLRLSPYPQFSFGGHFVSARSGHLSRALRGNEATHVVIDEAAFVPDELISEVVMPMLATTDGYMSLISTPNGRNHFWRYFQLGSRGEYGFWSRSAPSRENPLVSSRFLDVQRELASERTFAVEYEAEFIESAGQVFKYDHIERCLATELPEVGGAYFVGIDWGRYQDFTTLAIVKGTSDRCVLLQCSRLPQADWKVQISNIVEILRVYPPATVLVDGNGYGDVLFGDLRDAVPRHSIREYKFTLSSKTTLVNHLASVIERERLTMRPNPPLLRELESFRFHQTRSGNTKLEASAGEHDDLVIALALAVFELPCGGGIRIASGNRRTFDPKI